MRHYYWIIAGWLVTIAVLWAANYADHLLWSTRASMLVPVFFTGVFTVIWAAVAALQFTNQDER